jgi:hypothetical protein
VTTALSREELKRLYEVAIDRAAVSDAAIFTAIADKIARIIAESSSVRQWGEKIFEWRLPLSIEKIRTKGAKAGQKMTVVLAPSLNVWGRLHPGQRAQLQSALDVRILAELHKWPQWRHMGRARGVRITRYSSQPPDEVAADSIGAKAPLDRLVAGGVLRGDALHDLERDPRWEKAPPGRGSLLLEVHEML